MEQRGRLHWLIGRGGRPLAVFVLLLSIVLQLLSETLPQLQVEIPASIKETTTQLNTPFTSARNWLIDHYQMLWPRVPNSQPVTIVAIDEKSLAALGQWPWPRDRMANLIQQVNDSKPAAIGLDIFMPEADQSSPEQLAKRLPENLNPLGDVLRQLPENDYLLAKTLHASPSVLGVAGFDFRTYATTSGVRSIPMKVDGDDPVRFVRSYPFVLASLPQLQAAAHGQAILSVVTGPGGIRRVPLLAAIGDHLVPGLAIEMFRVGTGTPAVEIRAGKYGVEQLRISDLVVSSLPDGDIYPHFARFSDTQRRYVSAVDVLEGHVDPSMLASKLVLIGLTGLGLSDMRTTALGERVPGVEIQAQTIEAIFEGELLKRPAWLGWLELVIVGVSGSLLIWLFPRSDNSLYRQLRQKPQLGLGFAVLLALVAGAIGLLAFRFGNWLFDAAFVAIMLSSIVVILIVGDTIENLADARAKLARLVDNGIALGQAAQRETILKMTLEGAREITCCRSANLYLFDEEHRLQLALSTSSGIALELPTVGQDDMHPGWIPIQVAQSGESIFVDELLRDVRYSPDASWSSTLAVPMLLNSNEVLGVIQLFDALYPSSAKVIPFEPRLVNFVEALAAQAAVALQNQNLVQAQKDLMDATIRIIAGAIDIKSPYTGAHCKRVPELAMQLAEAACAQTEGPLADFQMKSDDEWREFHIGAWLHDCGKVTTPEYVVDKATKLETIVNRIHEIRTRFEVILRDAQIRRLQAIYEKGEDSAIADAAYNKEKEALFDDFRFIAECNIGGEFVAPDQVGRIKQIASRTWLRHFDNRLGLSVEEQNRFRGERPVDLPVKEQLLADRPEHIVDRKPDEALDPRYGFKLEVPEHLYNFGEVYNLSIDHGTLTAEERFKINEHIIQTIVMLESLPLPDNLKKVPEYAGTHHETMVGTGYPRKLRKEELSIPARIMAIADIFEALTAADRPYKKAKPLSEAIRILSFFRNDEHIDSDLFELFLSSGVYRDYAERFLRPDQIDAVDISQYLG